MGGSSAGVGRRAVGGAGRKRDFRVLGLGSVGGDEFTVMLQKISHPEDAAVVASDIMSSLSQPWTLSNGAEVRIGVSIGISIFPEHGTTTNHLLQHADAALYAGLFDGAEAAELPLDPARRGYVHLVRGELSVNGQPLRGGDAALIAGESRVSLSGGREAEVLVFDLAA